MDMSHDVVVLVSDPTLRRRASELLTAAGYTVSWEFDPRKDGVPASAVFVIDEPMADVYEARLHGVLRKGRGLLLQTSLEARRTNRALRDGFRECILLPEELSQLPAAVNRQLTGAPEPSYLRQNESNHEVLAVYSATGGSGRTLISAHLAAIVARMGLSTLALDLDLQFSGLRNALGSEGISGISELLPVLHELQETHLQNAVDSLAGNLDLLTAASMDAATEIKDHQVRQLVEVCTHIYPVVIVDVPAAITPAALEVLTSATQVLYILEPTNQGLAAMGVLLNRLGAMELPRDQIKVVINHRSPHLVSLSAADIRRMNCLSVAGEIGFDPNAPFAPILRPRRERSVTGIGKDVATLAGGLFAAKRGQSSKRLANPTSKGFLSRLFGWNSGQRREA